MSNVIESIERAQLRDGIPQFKAGDTVRVHFQVIEGQRRRVQVFEGIVIKRQGAGVRETFTVRKQSFGVGVERTFPLHSPKIERLEVMAIGDVRRAKLYYLRGRVGKKARVREKQSARPAPGASWRSRRRWTPWSPPSSSRRPSPRRQRPSRSRPRPRAPQTASPSPPKPKRKTFSTGGRSS